MKTKSKKLKLQDGGPDKLDYTGMGLGYIEQNLKPNPFYNANSTHKKRMSKSGNIDLSPLINKGFRDVKGTFKKTITPIVSNLDNRKKESKLSQYEKDIIDERTRLEKKYPNTKKFGAIPRDEYLDFAAKGLVDAKYKPTKDKVKDFAINAGMAILPEMLLGDAIPGLSKALSPKNPLLEEGEASVRNLLRDRPYIPMEDRNALRLRNIPNQATIKPNPYSRGSSQAADYINHLSDNDLNLFRRYLLTNNTGNEETNLSNFRHFLRDFDANAHEPGYVQGRYRNAEPVKQIPTNRSELTKDELLKHPALKDKDVISKMSEDEFSNTVLKPTGEVVQYTPTNKLKIKQRASGVGPLLEDAEPMTPQEYTDHLNSKLGILNDIIEKNNSSGTPYKAREFTPQGYIVFESPEGQSTFSVNMNPAKWKGKVQDIASTDYYKAVPGISMSNSSSSVFPNGPKSGTRIYKSLNQFLKHPEVNAGRVKTSFNSSQTRDIIDPQGKTRRGSFSTWEDAVRKPAEEEGSAVGHYKGNVIEAVMRSILPVGIGEAAASTLSEQDKEKSAGGKIMATKKGFRKKKKGYNQSPDLMGERDRYMQSLGPNETAYAKGGWILPAVETIAGAGMTAFGMPEAGIPMMVSGGAGLIGDLTAPKSKITDYSKENVHPRTVGVGNMTPNVTGYKWGGLLDVNINSPSLKRFAEINPDSKINKLIDVNPGVIEEFKNGGKVHKVMHEYKQGKLHSGSKKGPKVTSRKQAIAIALSEERRGKKAMGGMMDSPYDENAQLETFQGPTHEQGGMQISDNAEVEGGETKYKDVVNSDRIIITKEIAEHYGLPKVAVGKTVADYSKKVAKRYKGREKEWPSSNSYQMEMNNIAKMSTDLAQMHEQSIHKAYGGKMYAYGDEIDRPENVSDTTRHYNPDDWFKEHLPVIGKSLKQVLLGAHGEQFINPFKDQQPNQNNIDTQDNFKNVLPPPIIPGELNSASKASLGTKRPSIIPEFDNSMIPQSVYDVNAYLDNPSMSEVNSNASLNKLSLDSSSKNIDTTKLAKMNLPDVKMGKASDSFKGMDNSDMNDGSKLTGAGVLGMAPAAINAFMAGRTAGEGPDTVKLGRIQPEEVHPGFIDPTYALQATGDTFNTANREMAATSKTDFLRRRIQSATEESKAKSGILGQIRGANTEMLNRAKEMNASNKMRAGEINLNAQREEENINAANRGAWQTARDYQLSNLGTSMGEIGRDIRADKTQDIFKKEELDVYNNMGYGMQMVPDGNGGYKLVRNAISFDTGKKDPYANSIYPNKENNSWRYKSNIKLPQLSQNGFTDYEKRVNSNI